jgi:hypothetical protein
MEKNKLIFPLITAVMIAVAYFVAFHKERDKNKVLEEKIIRLENKKNG